MQNSDGRETLNRSWKGWAGRPISRVLYPQEGGGHPSSPGVAARVKQPTRGHRPSAADQLPVTRGHMVVVLPLYLVLLRVGFARPAGLPAAGELLPRHFTLACTGKRYVSVALSVGLPLLGVTQHPARRSSDFPPRVLDAEQPPDLPDPRQIVRLFWNGGQLERATRRRRYVRSSRT